MLRVALTGGIASGKTAVSTQFQSLGVPVIDADVASRAVVAKDSDGLASLVRHFGVEILTPENELNRSVLRQLIFAEPEKRALVNQLLHPLIREHMRKEADQCAHKATPPPPYLIYAIPLLLETDQAKDYDRVITVTADETVRVQRLIHRDKISAKDAYAILAAQAPESARLAMADHIIENNGGMDTLNEQVQTLHNLLLEIAKQKTQGQ